MKNKKLHISVFIFIFGAILNGMYAQSRGVCSDSLLKDSIQPIVYTGLSKKVVDYLELHPNTRHLSQFLSDVYGVEIDSNQALLLNIAASNYGLQDIIGDSNNIEVLRFFSETNHADIVDDETSWCSSYMCWCAQNVKLENTSSLLARSWLEIGTVVDEPKQVILLFFGERKKDHGKVM